MSVRLEANQPCAILTASSMEGREMKLERVIIEGFRSYRERIEIEISDMTAFIGENDVGKTSILEALDGFFNDVISAQDLSTRGGNDKIVVGCVFSNLPDEIILDTYSITTLKSEYLLNSDGMLEIYKEWDITETKASTPRVYAKAIAPKNEEIVNLLSKNNTDLKKIVKENSIEVDNTNNSKMRQEIYKLFRENGELHLDVCDIPLQSSERGNAASISRQIWNNINSRHLPIYTLFKAEHVHGDREKYVRSPLDLALKSAIKKFDQKLLEISSDIMENVKGTTNRTLERLKRDYPDIAKDLKPEYSSPDWSKAFSLDLLRSDDDVPLSKRGSGVRRLVVLAFFQAEADRRREEREDGTTGTPVIYAIEEPETSQHPNFQRNIIRAFLDLSKGVDQVIITTHVPALAELLPKSSIRFVERLEGNPTPSIHNGATDRDVLMRAAESLGVLPSSYPVKDAQIAVWVEGLTDIWALDGFAKSLLKDDSIPEDLDIERIFYVFGGGCDQLKFEVNGRFLDMLGLPQFYLVDSDKRSIEDYEEDKIGDSLRNRIDEWKSDGKGLPIDAAATFKREIENYVHPAAIKRLCSKDSNLLSEIPESVWDFGDISDKSGDLWKSLREGKFRCPGDRKLRGTFVKAGKAKHVICGVLLPEMNANEIRERCGTTDKKNEEVCEVEGWFHTMARLVREH